MSCREGCRVAGLSGLGGPSGPSGHGLFLAPCCRDTPAARRAPRPADRPAGPRPAAHRPSGRSERSRSRAPAGARAQAPTALALRVRTAQAVRGTEPGAKGACTLRLRLRLRPGLRLRLVDSVSNSAIVVCLDWFGPGLGPNLWPPPPLQPDAACPPRCRICRSRFESTTPDSNLLRRAPGPPRDSALRGPAGGPPSRAGGPDRTSCGGASPGRRSTLLLEEDRGSRPWAGEAPPPRAGAAAATAEPVGKPLAAAQPAERAERAGGRGQDAGAPPGGNDCDRNHCSARTQDSSSAAAQWPFTRLGRGP
jgi:hypothetical protein